MYREVWPEDNYFGNSGLNSNEELDIFKQIFYADLAKPAGRTWKFMFSKTVCNFNCLLC